MLWSQTWPKYYGQSNRIDRSKDIIETYDKGYLILGGYQAFSWLIKTDINGNILWEIIIDNYPRELPTAQAIEAAKRWRRFWYAALLYPVSAIKDVRL